MITKGKYTLRVIIQVATKSRNKKIPILSRCAYLQCIVRQAKNILLLHVCPPLNTIQIANHVLSGPQETFVQKAAER